MPFSSEELAESLHRALDALHALGVRHHVTGGLAASAYGDPRATFDIDIVIDAAPRAILPRIVAVFQPAFLVEPEEARIALASNGMFQALDLTTFLKVDLHVGEAMPGEFDRTVLGPLLDSRPVPTVHPVDAVVS